MDFEDNISPIDKWSFGHMAIGIILGMLNISFLLMFIIAVGWELFEIPLERRHKTWFTKNPESNINRISDVIFDILGWVLGIALFGVIFS